MPIIAMSSGKVTAIWGNAYVRLPDGSFKPMKVGDEVVGGMRIVTDQDGIVEISPERGPAVAIDGNALRAPVDRAIAAIESGEIDAVPAAGLLSGGDGSLRDGLRVERVAEGVGLDGGFAFVPVAERNEVIQGSSADQRELPTLLAGLPGTDPDLNPDPGPGPDPVDPNLGVKVTLVDVKAASGAYVYFGVQLSGSSDEPTVLKLVLTPGEEVWGPGDVWTGAMSYSLDALTGSPDQVDFTGWPEMGGEPGWRFESTSEGIIATLTVPPLTDGGLVLLKVPAFQAEDGVTQPHDDVIKLSASVQDDPTVVSGQYVMPHLPSEDLDFDPVRGQYFDPVKGVWVDASPTPEVVPVPEQDPVRGLNLAAMADEAPAAGAPAQMLHPHDVLRFDGDDVLSLLPGDPNGGAGVSSGPVPLPVPVAAVPDLNFVGQDVAKLFVEQPAHAY